MKRLVRCRLRVALLAWLLVSLTSGPARSAETSAQRNARLLWWREARFGMFVHWGPVSLKGTEIGWSRNPGPNGSQDGSIPAAEYDELFKQFNPTNFNASEWVSIARRAGMKYLVFTTKHHDGFCEFDSQLTNYKITSPESPFQRDVVKELAQACHTAGLSLGCYYSQPDAHHPDYRTANHPRYVEYFHGQVRELLSNYGKVDIIWFDGLGGSAQDWAAEKLFPMIRQLQPDILINNRCGLPGDFDTPEQRVGSFKTEPWETCMTICQQWAWKPGDQMKSLKECVQTLVRCAAGDGNLLFNVGPMPDGRIEPRQVERLREVGAWLGKNGESIYGTRGGPWKPTRNLASTRKDQTVFLHLLGSGYDPLQLPDLPAKIKSAQLLSGGTVTFTQREGKLDLQLAPSEVDALDTVVRLELDRSALELGIIEMPGGVSSKASNVFQKLSADFGPQCAFDCDPETRWATDAGTKRACISVDGGKPLAVRGVRIQEALEERVSRFEFQYRQDQVWKTIFKGETIGPRYKHEFQPVTAQEFRLNILDAKEGPTIAEIELIPQ